MPSRAAVALLVLAALAGLSPGATSAETERWTVESGKSRFGFDAFHAWGNFSGASESPTGEIELDVTDLKKPVAGGLTVPVASFRTGKAGRDKDLRRNLDGERHPQVSYRIDKVESSFTSVAENSDVLLTIHGVLTMRGTERPATFMGRVRLRDGALWARGESRIRPLDFGVPPLRSWLIAMKEYVLVTFDLSLSKPK
jgi:polyisoprenoid-binding protein YceI